MATKKRSAPSAPAPLNDRQERFVREYLVDLNATQAAIRAGYSARSASSTAEALLKHPAVASRVREAAETQATDADLRAADVLRELRQLAFVDPAAAFGPDGLPKPLHEIPEDTRRAIVGIDGSGPVRKIRFGDKLRALELLGKHLALFTDRVEHTGTDGEPIRVVYVNDWSDDGAA